MVLFCFSMEEGGYHIRGNDDISDAVRFDGCDGIASVFGGAAL